MTERTIEKKRALIAERIMGWSLSHHNLYSNYVDDFVGHRFYVSDWKPNVDITQAMQIVEALRQNGWRYSLMGFPQELTVMGIPFLVAADWFGKGGYPANQHVTGEGETQALAIMDVAVQIAESMEAGE